MFCANQPGSESRANACVDRLGTREIPVSPFAKSGIGPTPVTKVLGQKLLRGFCQRTSEEANGIGARAMSEAPEMDKGSLSALIVPIESRETQPEGSL